MMWVIVGGEPVDIITSPLIVVFFKLPAMDEDTFFNPDLIANNFALFFGIPPDAVKVVNSVRETRRKRQAGTWDVSTYYQFLYVPHTVNPLYLAILHSKCISVPLI